MRQMQKHAPVTHLTANRYKDNLKKKNYPAYNGPEPGEGLLLYRDRLTQIVCPGKQACKRCHNRYYIQEEASNILNCRCEECNCIIPTTFKNFFKVFPPKLKCPSTKPDYQKLSFMDDPPYTDYSEFLSKLHYPEIRYLEKETNKRLVFNASRYYDIDRTYYYCRYQAPKWINPPEFMHECL